MKVMEVEGGWAGLTQDGGKHYKVPVNLRIMSQHIRFNYSVPGQLCLSLHSRELLTFFLLQPFMWKCKNYCSKIFSLYSKKSKPSAVLPDGM